MWLWTSVSISCRGPSSSHSHEFEKRDGNKLNASQDGFSFFCTWINSIQIIWICYIFKFWNRTAWTDMKRSSTFITVLLFLGNGIDPWNIVLVCLIFGRSGRHDQQWKWWLRLAFLRHQKLCHCVVRLLVRSVTTKITIIEARPYNINQLWTDYYSCSLCHSSWLEDIMMDPELRVSWCCHGHVDSRKVFPKGVMRKIF